MKNWQIYKVSESNFKGIIFCNLFFEAKIYFLLRLRFQYLLIKFRFQ